jgi:hypothetical protein
VVPLTTNLDRANLAGTAMIASSPVGGPPHDSVALAFQNAGHPQVGVAGQDSQSDCPTALIRVVSRHWR